MVCSFGVGVLGPGVVSSNSVSISVSVSICESAVSRARTCEDSLLMLSVDTDLAYVLSMKYHWDLLHSGFSCFFGDRTAWEVGFIVGLFLLNFKDCIFSLLAFA